VFVKKIRQTCVVFLTAREEEELKKKKKKKMQKSLLSFLFRFLLLSYNKRIIPEQQSS
jgi:hypothetical protein